MLKRLLFLVIMISLLVTTSPGFAQSQSSDLPVYIVQPGDTLGAIAQRFGVPLATLIDVNGITDPNSIAVGMPLKIPGLEGITGTLITQPVPLGETFESMAARYQISTSVLARLNRVTSPQELYAGASLVLPEDKEKGKAQALSILSPGQSLLEASAEMNDNPWVPVLLDQDITGMETVPGDILFSKQADTSGEVTSISPLIQKIEISPLPLVQGKTTVVRIETTQPVTLSGKLDGNDLQFFQEKENQYVALQGIYALAQPGLTDVSLSGQSQDGKRFDYSGMLILKEGYYPKDPPLTVDPKTIDPAVTKPEENEIAAIISKVTPTKYWNGMFHVPVDEPVCYKSTFGDRRSYNGGPYNSFHSGTDFGVCASLNIYAAADGVVVFTGPLTVRGNATIIDHGWGVFTGYWHQSDIKVKVGDHVKAGQLIGLIGATGRVTGPHLHFEVMVNKVQVEPVDWLQQVFP